MSNADKVHVASLSTKSVGTKFCPSCTLTKATESFWNDRSKPDGKDTYCKECVKAKRREASPEMKAKRNAKRREQYASDSVAKERSTARARSYYQRRKEAVLLQARKRREEEKRTDPDRRSARLRAQWLKQRYGLTPTEVERMALEQEGRCALCSEEADLVVDHDHETNHVRALLCQTCNRKLGFYEKAKASGQVELFENYLALHEERWVAARG